MEKREVCFFQVCPQSSNWNFGKHLCTPIIIPVSQTALFGAFTPPFLPMAEQGALRCKMVQTIFLYPEAKQAQPGAGTIPDTRAPAAVRAGERGWEKGGEKRGRKG